MSFGFGLLSGGLLIGFSEKFEDTVMILDREDETSPTEIDEVKNEPLKEWLTKWKRNSQVG